MAVVPHCSTFPSVSNTVQGLSNSGFVLACLHLLQGFYPEHLPMCWNVMADADGAVAWQRGKHRAGVTVWGNLQMGVGVCVRPVTWSSKSSATWGEVSWRQDTSCVLLSVPLQPHHLLQDKRKGSLADVENWVRMPVMRGNCMPLLRSPEDLRGDEKFCAAPPGWR